MCDYVVKLTKDAVQCSPLDLDKLRAVGFEDKGILQITLIASWFTTSTAQPMHWALAAKLLRRTLKKYLPISSAQAVVVSFFSLFLFLQSRKRKASKLALLSRCHRKSWTPFRSHNGALAKVLAGDSGSRSRVYRLRQRWMAGHFLVNGTDWPGHGQKRTTPKLYHNNHDGTFTDVTHKAGLDVEMFGIGVAVGDYDNDGYDDLFVTAYGQSHLFHNNGTARLPTFTQKAGLGGSKEFSTSAAWVDYDKDGKLDLVVGNYVQWTPETDLIAPWTARANRIARPNRTRERRCGCGITMVGTAMETLLSPM